MTDGLSAPPPYEGEEPFVFVSYAHADKDLVYHDLGEIARAGYRIWYDGGIHVGERYSSVIVSRIDRCAAFVGFLSNNAFARDKPTWVQNEIHYAQEEAKKPIVPIYLEETNLPSEIKLLIGFNQAVFRYATDRNEYLRRLMRGLPPEARGSDGGGGRNPVAEQVYRTVKNALSEGRTYTTSEATRLAVLLGMPESESEKAVAAIFNDLGLGADSESGLETLNELLAFLFEKGHFSAIKDIAPAKAKEAGVPDALWHPLLNNKAIEFAKELRARGDARGARELLVSIAPVIPQSDELRHLLEDLQDQLTAAKPAAQPSSSPDSAWEPAASPSSESRTPPSRPRESAVTPLPGNLAIEWVNIPSGMFTRGCPPEFIEHVKRKFAVQNADTVLGTYPMRREPVDEYWISRTPVTNAQYVVYLSATGKPYSIDPAERDHPRTNISWDEATAFAEWLGVRLPSRAEFEKACRGEDGRLFPWGNTFDPELCNTAEAGPGHILPVASNPGNRSPYGVLDLVGNVWEWCADRDESMRKTVGAGFASTGEIYGASFFDMGRPASASGEVGFRLACADPGTVSIPAAN